jgi:hypothetical protein
MSVSTNNDLDLTMGIIKEENFNDDDEEDICLLE